MPESKRDDKRGVRSEREHNQQAEDKKNHSRNDEQSGLFIGNTSIDLCHFKTPRSLQEPCPPTTTRHGACETNAKVFRSLRLKTMGSLRPSA